MKNARLYTAALTITLGISLFSSCKKKDDFPIKSNAETFRTDLFKQNLKTALGTPRGFGFIITQNGQIADTAQGGIGTSSRSGATTPYSIDDFINIASITKTYTGTVVQMFLRYRPELTLESPIGPWLPDTWTIDPDFAKISFRQLLQQRSGIRGGQTNWSDLKNIAAAPPEGDTAYSYSNRNFALFRAILPKMNNLQVYNIEKAKGEASFNQWMSDRYIMIMQDNIFKKLGQQDRACKVVAGKTMDMLNEEPYDVVVGSNSDWTNSCGGGGFYLTTRDLSKFITYLANTEDFLTNTEKARMDAMVLGWRTSFAVKYGTAYGHGGGLFEDSIDDDALTPGEPGLQTIIMKFPNKVELALTINSIPETWRDMYGLVVKAYNDSWVK